MRAKRVASGPPLPPDGEGSKRLGLILAGAILIILTLGGVIASILDFAKAERIWFVLGPIISAGVLALVGRRT